MVFLLLVGLTGNAVKNFMKEGVKIVRPSLPSFGVEQDDFGHTNVLLLGVAGAQEQGGLLTDSMMVISINPHVPSASFLNVPRDLYVRSQVGQRKINSVYPVAYAKYKDHQKAFEVVKGSISEFTGVDIHYAVEVNFQIFADIVDTLGGINIYVPETINDPYYPADNYQYQTFIARKGNQTMNGDMALKYARSRQTTSDYSRAQRQQDILLGIKNKASNLNLLSNFDKLTRLYQTYFKNVHTDLNLSEIFALAKIAQAIDYENSTFAVLNDEEDQKGGFLYSPERHIYGQYVLLPERKQDTKKFTQLLLSEPEVYLEKSQISVLNGTKTPGLAGRVASRLKNFGFHVIETGNYESQNEIERSFFRKVSQKETPAMDTFLEDYLSLLPPFGEFDGENYPEDSLVDIQIVIGTDFLKEEDDL